MNRAKLAILLLISFVATASVVYQIQNRRPVRGAIVGSVPQPIKASGSGSAKAAPAPAVIASADAGDAAKAQPGRGPAPNIPASGWGRNPFLTLEEINKLNQPEQPVAVVEKPQPKAPAEPPALPLYAVTGIIAGEQGRWAILDGRLLRPGERIGTETLREVRDRGVVLEHEGQMRELPLKNLEDTAAAAPPKKEAKP